MSKKDRKMVPIVLCNSQKKQKKSSELECEDFVGANQSVPSLFQLCFYQLSHGPLVGSIEILPVEVAEELLMSTLPQMTSLTIMSQYIHSGLQNFDIRKLPRNLSLPDLLITASMKCPLVKSLSLPSHTSDVFLQNLKSRIGGCPFPKLNSFHLEGSSGVSTSAIKSLIEGLDDGLRKIYLANCFMLTDSVLKIILKESEKTLEELCLAGCKENSYELAYKATLVVRLTDETIECLPGGLVKLDLSGVWRLTDRAVEKISRRCPDLKELDISGDPRAGGQLTVFGAARLSGLKKLSTLKLMHQKHVGNLILSRIKTNLPGIQITV